MFPSLRPVGLGRSGTILHSPGHGGADTPGFCPSASRAVSEQPQGGKPDDGSLKRPAGSVEIVASCEAPRCGTLRQVHDNSSKKDGSQSPRRGERTLATDSSAERGRQGEERQEAQRTIEENEPCPSRTFDRRRSCHRASLSVRQLSGQGVASLRSALVIV